MANNPGNPLHQDGYLLKERYRIMYKLDSGGFGQPYVAKDEQNNNRQCVVKQLCPTFRNPQALEQARAKFKQEANMLQLLGHHDQIPQFIEFFEENKEFYLVQEFIIGQSLNHVINSENPWNEQAVISLLQDVLKVLVEIHKKNVIHRDIKPGNLIRRHRDGKIVLIDFGGVKEVATSLSGSGQGHLSKFGTQDYQAPEQAKGNSQFNSDIYALGITAIQALTGESPGSFNRDGQGKVIFWQEKTELSQKLAKILDKMVRQDDRERYQSASEVLADLNPQHRRINWRLWGGLGLATATILLIVLGWILPFVRSILLYKEATELVKSKKYEAAIEPYNQAIALNSNFPEALADRGYALINLTKYEEGLKSCEAAIKLRQDDSNSWNCKGVALERLGNNKRAIAAYQEAIKLDPTFPEPWNNKGEVLLKEQEPEQALSTFDDAIRRKPDYRLAWTNKGKALHQLRKYEEAVNAFKEAIKIDNNYSAWIGLGNALRQLENRDLEALDAYEMAIKIDPTIFDGWFAKGAVLENLKRQQEALVAYEKAAELRPDYDPLKEKIQRLK